MRTGPGTPRPTRRRRALGALATAGLLALTVAPPASAAESLGSAATERGIDLGFALDPGRLGESAYRQIADTEFTYVVAENAMKWDATEPSRNSFSFGSADQVRDYAQSTGKGLYGHTLVWHSQLPGWVQGIGTASDLLAAMRNHIAVVAGRYAGDVEAWDVVNEAFEDNGSRRQSVFQQRIGNSYIEEAFRAARQADPTAKLCINDYSIEGINAKSTAIYDLVRDFKARGVPIDCVGFQSHLIVGQVPGNMRQNLQRFADLGVDVRITELDIRTSTPASASALQQQGRDYAAVLEHCLAVTRCQGVTIWGITDRYSWVPDVFPGQGEALVWDASYNRKPAYDAIAAVLGVDPDPDPDPDPAPDPGDGTCTAQLTIVNAWPGGYQGEVRVTAGAAAITGWSTSFTVGSDTRFVNIWNAVGSQSGTTYTAVNASYNGSLAAGGSTAYGFVGSGTVPSGAVSCTS